MSLASSGGPKEKCNPIRLAQRLPVVAIPLRGGDPDAKLDLQEVLNTAYDRAAYDLEIDYRKEPDPPLPSEYSDWASRILVSKGVR